MNNLKPCPFCGSLDIQKFMLPAAQSPTGVDAHVRNCTDCGGSTAGFATVEEVESAWNQRMKGN